jgi:hypothetical protein
LDQAFFIIIWELSAREKLLHIVISRSYWRGAEV